MLRRFLAAGAVLACVAAAPIPYYSSWDTGNPVGMANDLVQKVNGAILALGFGSPNWSGARYGGDVQIGGAQDGNPAQQCKVTTTAGSTMLMVSGTSCSPFLATDVGKIMVVTNAGATATAPWIGTIAAFWSPSILSISSAAGQTLVAAVAPFRWGHDEGSFIQACIGAAQVAGTACHLPPAAHGQCWGSTVEINARPNDAPASLIGGGRHVSIICALAVNDSLIMTGSSGAAKGGTVNGVGFDGGKLVTDVGYISCSPDSDWRDVGFFNAGSDGDLVWGDAAALDAGCSGGSSIAGELRNNEAYYGGGDYPNSGLTVGIPDNRFFGLKISEFASFGIQDTSGGDNQFFGPHPFAPDGGSNAIGVYVNRKDSVFAATCDNGILTCIFVNGSDNYVSGVIKQGTTPNGSVGVEVAASTNYNIVTGVNNTLVPSSSVVWDLPLGTGNCSSANISATNPPAACD